MENQPTPGQPEGGGNDNTGNSINQTYEAIQQDISQGITLISNTLSNDQIREIMNDAGYTPEVLQGKLEELEAVRTANETQRQEYGEQYDATSELDAGRALFNKKYIKELGLARLVLNDNAGAVTALGLKGRRALSISGYIGQALQFYNNALKIPAYKAAVAKKGVKEANLQAGQAGAHNLQELLDKQQKEMGEAQQATAKRDELYDLAADWLAEYRATARLVLAEHDQLMEEIGIIDPS